MNNPKPSVRSLTGMFIMIFGLMLYAFACAAIGDELKDTHLAIQMVFYTIAGIIWIFPVKRLLKWMDAAHKDSEQ